MKRALFSSVIMLLTLISNAQQISENDALKIAQQFMQSKQFVKVESRQTTRQDSNDDAPAYYVFNAQNDGGFVIVSGDERTRKAVLGYSEKGHFDYDNLPSNAKAWMDGYAEDIRIMRSGNIEAKASSRTNGDYPSSVKPLLGDTEWGQQSPYNDMCPIIDGQHAPTGCVATAMAQVMYYYKWPEQGHGIVEGYYISGKGVDEATDLSKSIYQWNLMLPQYTTGASKDSREAVALLLHDIGRSVHMDYDSSESGASSHYVIPVLTTNFDYDKGGRFLQRNFCSTEKWEDVLRSEISNGRPVMYSASNGSTSHEFVCDGYDDKGYFYFNYGWNGASNGYYLTSATLFNIGQEIIYGIEKNKGGEGQLSLMSKADFMYDDSKDEITCELAVVCLGDQVPIELAIAATNTSTNKTDYFIQKEDVSDLPSSGVVGTKYANLTFKNKLSDGNYQIYPVCRVKDKEWEQFYFADDRQTFIDVTVKNGKKNYTNNHVNNAVDSGTTEIDGIFYKLYKNMKTATVTYKNNKYNSYKGYVEIPDEVTYENTTYIVNAIGEGAFWDCEKLDSIKVGANVESIGSSFYKSQLTKIHFAEKSKLLGIGAFAFQYAEIKEIYLPNGLESLGNNTFECCYRLEKVVMPSTVTSMGKKIFNGCGINKKFIVYVERTNPTIPTSAFTGWEKGPENWVLYVPRGSLEAYKNAQYWRDFGTILEISEESLSTIHDVKNDCLCYDVYNLAGNLIQSKVSNLDGIRNGVYIVVPSGEPWKGNNARKLIKH